MLLEDRTLLQVDQAKSEDQELLRHERECSEDSDLVCAVCLFDGSLSQIPVRIGLLAVKASCADQGQHHGKGEHSDDLVSGAEPNTPRNSQTSTGANFWRLTPGNHRWATSAVADSSPVALVSVRYYMEVNRTAVSCYILLP